LMRGTRQLIRCTASGYPPFIRHHAQPPSPSRASATRSRSES
jgi:hypothetical protein